MKKKIRPYRQHTGISWMYYNKVMKYVELKYRKRYLQKQAQLP